MKYVIVASLLIGLFVGATRPPRPNAARPNAADRSPARPNVVLIFMDDLGYGDLGCYGATGYQTPHIDRLAAGGVRLTNFLSAQPVCTASRAGLLTGCYPNRIGLHGALFPNAKTGINPAETTLPELLKQRGYATAIFGKWHLGDQPEFRPTRHGFDEFLGLPYSNDMWPVHFDGQPATIKSVKGRFTALPLLQGNGDTLRLIETLDDQAALTETLTTRAVDFIGRNRKKPFFLYLPYHMPHVPIAASARFRGRTQRGLFGDMMTEIDEAVGRVLQALTANGLDRQTIVVFTSDNGPWYNFGNHAGTTAGLREGKGATYEGGNRVPCLIRWPGTLPGGTVCNGLASTLDLLPTLTARCGADKPTLRIDGLDIWPLLTGQTMKSPRRDFYYYYRKNNLEAVRRDNWKLVLPHPGRTYTLHPAGADGFPGNTEENHPEPLALYDLSRDPGERYDVQAQHPDVVAALQQLAETARQDLGDDLTKRTGANNRPVGQVSQ